MFSVNGLTQIFIVSLYYISKHSSCNLAVLSIPQDTWYCLLFVQSLGPFYVFDKVVFWTKCYNSLALFVGNSAATFFLHQRTENTMWLERLYLMVSVSSCVPSAWWQKSSQASRFKTFGSKEPWRSATGNRIKCKLQFIPEACAKPACKRLCSASAFT